MRTHVPVLLSETLEFLSVGSTGTYVDCTVGMGGHAEKILEGSAPDGFLLGIDRDAEALREAELRLANFHNRFRLVHGDYRMIRSLLEEQNVSAPNGILADFGASMLQFSTPERGFSFQTEGPLDMRMDRTQGRTAADIVNSADVQELTRIFREYGEEKGAYRVAKRIVEERKLAPIDSTVRFAELVKASVQWERDKAIHPATRVFQALRIAVNSELDGLDAFVFDAFDSLVIGGRLVIIAFHSLEDRIVKQTFQFLSAACRCSRTLMACMCGGKPLSKVLTRRPVRPGDEETSRNPASRSSRLRVIEKIEGTTVQRDLWKTWVSERA